MKKLFVPLLLIPYLFGMDAEKEMQKKGWRDIPLHHACRDSNLENVRRLLKEGASVTETSYECGATALHWACWEPEKNKKIIELLLEKGALVNQGDENGETPLHWACSHSYKGTAVVAFLLQKGATVNVQDKNGLTSLHKAAKNSLGNKDLVTLLIQHKAKVNVPDKAGQTPIEGTYSEEVATILLDHGACIGGFFRNRGSIRMPLHYYMPMAVANAIQKRPDYRDRNW